MKPWTAGSYSLPFARGPAVASSRGPDELGVAVPPRRIIGIVHAIAQGIGHWRVGDREQVERQVDELGSVDPPEPGSGSTARWLSSATGICADRSSAGQEAACS
jgi:hypothetical protein